MVKALYDSQFNTFYSFLTSIKILSSFKVPSNGPEAKFNPMFSHNAHRQEPDY